ncbi:murein hydrolase activator EnvC family protein [Parvularcula maris]|uniref:M23 family metallopeptidase n=1 Tax=Parvularcula maris TaxID=2965077 RepID=A0A9X2RIX7_9PROT|nr:M23 family metallopeptidase [Parvularcula maris]MCQ8186539.1 M23 family metallopeptidase [Parvularcula maris]
MLRLSVLLASTLGLAACVTASDDRYVMPADGHVLPSASASESIRIKTDGRTRVRATRTGRVLFAGKTRQGRTVVLDHGGGMRSRYVGLQNLSVAKGEWVRSGKPVGWVGKRQDREAELNFGLSLAQARLDPMQVIEAPTMAKPPKVRVRIEDQADELDVLVERVTAPAADKYGPKPSGAGLVLEGDGPQKEAAQGGYAPGYDKYGPLPARSGPTL